MKEIPAGYLTESFSKSSVRAEPAEITAPQKSAAPAQGLNNKGLTH